MKLKYMSAIAVISLTAFVPASAQDMHPSTGTPHAGGKAPMGSTGGSHNGDMQNTPSHGDEGGAGPGGMGGQSRGINDHSMDHGPGMENGDRVVPHHDMTGRGMDDREMRGDRGGMHRGGHCRMVGRDHHRVRRCM